MFILASGGATYVRLRFNTGPGSEAEIAVDIDYTHPFAASVEQTWEEEYLANVLAVPLLSQETFRTGHDATSTQDGVRRRLADGMVGRSVLCGIPRRSRKEAE